LKDYRSDVFTLERTASPHALSKAGNPCGCGKPKSKYSQRCDECVQREMEECKAQAAAEKSSGLSLLSKRVKGIFAATTIGTGLYKRFKRVFRWFRKPPEVMQAVTALETIRSMFNSSDPFTANASDHLFAAVRATIVRDSDRTIHSLSADGWQPTDLALLLLTKASSRALSSGHIPRRTWVGKATGI